MPAGGDAEIVWGAGYWAWDGRAYVWIPGGWQRAPERGLGREWPRWEAGDEGVIFVPGRRRR